jgi:hypothetical protein
MQPPQYDKKRKKKKGKEFRDRTNQISDGNRIGTNDETTPLDEGEPKIKSKYISRL